MKRIAHLVKRMASFDCAQDGEPVEPYLAHKDERRSLSVLRFMLQAERPDIEEAVMTHAGKEGDGSCV
jgi:hypothetical protein